ncbi:Sau3AI family type II restriction endonuclease [Mitsuokella sp.]|uniref:Sau3AI family type II restriction endonuclease n=1 Tax=Mitsuokella sp. TaxID=2049034 RepID=UPI002A82AC36|nr:Sau3AI family type II restriction endonuclease [Mitsuokella sp.]MDY4474476.1 Sau3AI family type II restriction endonuclease [Mitsuokella sp.]
MEMTPWYDKTDPSSIESYGRQMIGKTFRSIYEGAMASGRIHTIKEDKATYMARHADKNYKGGVGNLVEECWFGYRANSDAQADFPEAGVELKVTPYVETKKGFRAKERLVLTMINYMEIVKERDFEHSHLWEKAQLMLLVWYLHEKGMSDMDSTVDFVQLFTPPEEDLEIIHSDYQKIVAKIKAGKAHELSEGDTLYLGACTKSSSSKVRRQQPFSDEPAKPRAFSFKNSYMTYVLNHYILPGKQTYDPIIKHGKVDDFEDFVESRINAYQGMSERTLRQRFNLSQPSKSIYAQIVFRILGVKGNHCEEFEKAGIVVKTIRIQKNGKMKESMSFPSFRFQELADETWDDSTFGNYLRDTRFFFVVFRETPDGEYYLSGCKFWNMPYQDVEYGVRKVWQQTHDIIKEGRLVLTPDNRGRISNNLPNASDSPIAHVRPHGRNREDTYPLPDGTHLTVRDTGTGRGTWPNTTVFTKQCFWLNNSYILCQLKDIIL